VSKRISVRSIVGRFLEHSRIYWFDNGGQPEVYLGSADLMPRNLDRRVEALFPLHDPALVERVRRLLDLQLRDTAGAWLLDPDGVYQRPAANGPPYDSQAALLAGDLA
jgi:polyphosphate kinase